MQMNPQLVPNESPTPREISQHLIKSIARGVLAKYVRTKITSKLQEQLSCISEKLVAVSGSC